MALWGDHPEASVLLLIAVDRLSYLELVPHGEAAIDQFPPVAELSA